MGQDQLVIRALEPEDIDAIYRWENDPSVWEYSDVHTPYSRHVLTQYLLEAQSGDFYRDRQLRLVAQLDGQAVGCIDLFDYDPHHHRAGVGILVDSAFRRQGIAHRMVEYLKRYAHDVLQLHQLYCHVTIDNLASRQLFLKAGFTHAGTLNDWNYNPQSKQYQPAWILQVIL